jgi:transposase InsO family protein
MRRRRRGRRRLCPARSCALASPLTDSNSRPPPYHSEPDRVSRRPSRGGGPTSCSATSRRLARRVQPQDRRLAARDAHAHRPRPRRAEDGARSARRRCRRRVDPSLGSRLAAQYTSIEYGQTLDDHGVLASVGSVGDAYDNALAESLVDSFKTELISDRVWRTCSQLELAIVEYLGWFNNARLPRRTRSGSTGARELRRRRLRWPRGLRLRKIGRGTIRMVAA